MPSTIEPQPIPPDPAAEALVAVLDVEQLLERGRPIRITADQRQRAARLVRTEPDGVTIGGTVRDQVRRFLMRSEFAPADRDGPPFEYRRALDLLTELDPEARIAELSQAIPPEADAAGVVVAAANVLRHLKAQLPVRSRITYAGPKSVEPNDLVKYRFKRAFAVAQDPIEVFEHLNSGDLARDEVRALEAMYPSLLDAGRKALLQEMATIAGQRPNYSVPLAKARMIENLLLTRSWKPELAKLLQDAFKKSEPDQQGGPPPGRPLGDQAAKAAESPIQRATYR